MGCAEASTRFGRAAPNAILRGMAGGIAHTWGTTREERALRFPGDRSGDPVGELLWRGVDIEVPAEIAFRWLCQLRTAPYSYDWIDNGGRRSPRTLTQDLEQLERGQVVMSIFRLEEFEAPVHLTIETPPTSRGARLFGGVRVTYWVRPAAPGRVRLLVKLRVVYPRGLWGSLLRMALPFADLVMMRRQLLNLKALAEATQRNGSRG
jgi:hypothetical protein